MRKIWAIVGLLGLVAAVPVSVDIIFDDGAVKTNPVNDPQSIVVKNKDGTTYTLYEYVPPATQPVPPNTQPSQPVPPDAMNTGLAVSGIKESELTPVTVQFAPKAGQTYTKMNFTNGVLLNKGINGVTIRDCLVSGGRYGIQSNAGATGLVVENVEIRGTAGKGMLVHHTLGRRLYIHDVGSDGIFTDVDGDVQIYDSFITRCGKANPTDHVDGIQVHNPGNNLVFKANSIVLPASFYTNGDWGLLNSCIVLQSDWGAITGATIEGNWFNGGGYTVRLEEKNGYDISGVSVTGNQFTKDFQYGPLGITGTPAYTWTSNKYADGTPAN